MPVAGGIGGEEVDAGDAVDVRVHEAGHRDRPTARGQGADLGDEAVGDRHVPSTSSPPTSAASTPSRTKSAVVYTSGEVTGSLPTGNRQLKQKTMVLNNLSAEALTNPRWGKSIPADERRADRGARVAPGAEPGQGGARAEHARRSQPRRHRPPHRPVALDRLQHRRRARRARGWSSTATRTGRQRRGSGRPPDADRARPLRAARGGDRLRQAPPGRRPGGPLARGRSPRSGSRWRTTTQADEAIVTAADARRALLAEAGVDASGVLGVGMGIPGPIHESGHGRLVGDPARLGRARRPDERMSAAARRAGAGARTTRTWARWPSTPGAPAAAPRTSSTSSSPRASAPGS